MRVALKIGVNCLRRNTIGSCRLQQIFLLSHQVAPRYSINCVQRAPLSSDSKSSAPSQGSGDGTIKEAQQNAQQKSRDGRGKRNKKAYFGWKSFGIASALLGIVWTGLYYYKKSKRKAVETAYYKSLGKPAIGGPFDLIDQDGKPFTSKELLGKWALIYFGFTHCPDVCPDELEKIVKVVNQIEARRGPGSLVPVFISVDPDRDTPAAIKEYLKEFSTKFIGLTGDKRAIDSVSKRYRVYYSPGPKDKDQDYIVDHTIIMYLIDPEGKFVNYFGQNKTHEEVANEIIFEMKKFDKSPLFPGLNI